MKLYLFMLPSPTVFNCNSFLYSNSGIEDMFELRSRLTELHTELVIMQLLCTYGIEKNVGFLHTNKNNAQFQTNVLTAMVNAKINT